MAFVTDIPTRPPRESETFDITARVFMVGCPRSGTTLMQSLLTAHPQVFSVPESHLYTRLTSRRRVLRRLGLARWDAAEGFAQVTRALDLPESRPRGLTMRFYLRQFAHLLDEATLATGKRVWLEKTPRHLYYLPEIARTLTRAKFIHVLRDGADVVASLFEVTHAYPEIWGGARDLDACINRWNKDVALSLRYSDHPDHLLVRYEDLVADPEASVRQMVDFVGIPYTPKMLETYRQAAQRVIAPGEAWKGSVDGRIQRPERQKLGRLFSPARQAYIRERTRTLRGGNH